MSYGSALGVCAASDSDRCPAQELSGLPPAQPVPPAPAGLSRIANVVYKETAHVPRGPPENYNKNKYTNLEAECVCADHVILAGRSVA